jgi:predicted RNase H-like HicB family nuclease
MSDVREPKEAPEEVPTRRDTYDVGVATGGNVYLTVSGNGQGNIWLTPERARKLALSLAACANLVEGEDPKKVEEEVPPPGRRPDPREYSVQIHLVADEEGEEHDYYIAFCPDLGFSPCSGPGDTEQEALENFRKNLPGMMDFYEETGRKLPIPSWHCFDTGKIVKGERPELKKRREDAD